MKKIKNLSKEGRRELWPPQEGGGVRFSNKNWERAIIFTSKLFGGSVLKHYTFFKTTAAPPPPPPIVNYVLV